MKKINIKTEFITLGQLLKLLDIVSSGGEAKFYIKEHKIFVNGTLEDRRGRKLRKGDLVVLSDLKILIDDQNDDSKH